RATCDARQPRVLAGRIAVEIATEPVFQEERVEVPAGRSPRRYAALRVWRREHGPEVVLQFFRALPVSGIDVASTGPSRKEEANVIRRNRRSPSQGSGMRPPRRRHSCRTRRDIQFLSLAPAPRAPARVGDPPHLDEPTTMTRYRRLLALRS